MTEQNTFNLRSGQRVRAAYLVKHCEGLASVEGMELLLDADGSLLLYCGTDWTLRMSEGRWPVLPAWCWPVESWAFEKVDQIGSSGFDEIMSMSDVRNPVGEVCGLHLEFPAARLMVRSGEVLTWDITRGRGKKRAHRG